MSQGPTKEVGEVEGGDYARAFREASRLADEGRSWSGREPNCCFLNTGQLRFADVSATARFNYLDDSRALGVSDWDHDGDLDVFLVNRTAPQVRFLRNDWGSTQHHLSLRLIGTKTNRDGIGARVELYRTHESPPEIRTVTAGCSFLSQSSKWVHFGLGQDTRLSHVVVRWSGGAVERFSGDLRADGRYRLVEGTGTAERLPPRGDIPQWTSTEPKLPAGTEQARVVFRAPVPLPSLLAADISGQERPLTWPRPTLVTLWSSGCPSCRAELGEFTAHADEISARMRLVALNVDQLHRSAPELATTRDQIERLKLPFDVGLATPELMSKLEILRGELFSNRLPFPVPTSFLVNTQGEMISVYVGPVAVNSLLEDVELVDMPLPRRRERATRLSGRWLVPARRQPVVDLVSAFRDAGYTDDAAMYERLAAPQIALGYCGVALDAERKGDFANADQLYESALRTDPANGEVHNLRGEYFMRRQQAKKAFESFQQAVALDPSLAEAHFNLGGLQLVQRNFREAVQHYREAIRLDPHMAKAHAALGRLHQQINQWPAAEQYFKAALQADPYLAPVYVYLGIANLQQREFDVAERNFAAAVRIEPALSDAHEGLAKALVAQGKFAEGIARYRDAVRLNPASLTTQLELAWYLSTCPDPECRSGDEAVKIANAAQAQGPPSAHGLDVLAAAYAEAGEFPQAVKSIQSAIEQGAEGQAELLAARRRRLALYQQRLPYRLTPLVRSKNELESEGKQ